MEDSENDAVAMLLEGAMEDGEPPVDETGDNILDGSEHHDDAATEAAVDHSDEQLPESTEDADVGSADAAMPEGKLADSLMEDNNEDYAMAVGDGDENETVAEEHEEGIEMTDDVEESKEHVLDTDNAQAPDQEQEEESVEMSGETPEDFEGNEFTAQTNPLIVQNEPPHQLMEEADDPGEGESMEDAGKACHIADAEAADDGDALFTYDEGEPDETAQGKEVEGTMSQQEQDPDQSILEPSEAALEEEEEEAEPQIAASTSDADIQFENETQQAAGEQAVSDQTAVLPLEDEATGVAAGAEGFTILAGGDQLEGSLGGLEGKIVMGADGSVHLLTQESLRGMQLMEGDDKPEDQVNGEDAVAQMQLDIRAQLHEALLKQEKIKEEVEDREPDEDLPPQDEPNAEGGALATLASAALGHQAPENGMKSEPEVPDTKPDPNEPQWMDVGICKGTHCVVRSFYIPSEGQSWDKNWEGINTATLPDHRALAKLELEAGKAYKFRVAAINSCGRGPWSEISAFRTSMPGVPGAPSAIKISKTVEGAHLSWEPPPATSGVIEDYTVYMAVRSATTDSQVVSSGANQLAFVRIYQGADNQCSVGFETLSEAHIDTTTKAAILFRIAARNEKGLGPAIQVRWLQDGSIPSSTKPANAVRRVGSEMKPHGSIKRKKSECE